MKTMGFKIWYTDGSMVRSEDWALLPDTDVQIVMEYMGECYADDKRYRRVTDGCDWYWWNGEEVIGVRSDENGWQDKPDKENVKQGSMISDDQFKKLTAVAMTDLVW